MNTLVHEYTHIGLGFTDEAQTSAKAAYCLGY